MKKQTHHIQKQQVILDFPAEEEARKWNQNFYSFYYSDIFPSFATLLDKTIPEDDFYVIDRLEIDLGSISMDEFRISFLKKTDAELKRILKNGPVAASSAAREPEETVQHENEDMGRDREENLQIQQREKNLLECFYHFLDHGVLPWNSQVKKIPELEAEIRKNTGFDALTGASAFQERMNRLYARKRLYYQFSGALSEEIFRRIYSIEPDMLFSLQEELKTILSHFAKNAAARKKLSQELSGELWIRLISTTPVGTRHWASRFIRSEVKRNLRHLKPAEEEPLYKAILQELPSSSLLVPHIKAILSSTEVSRKPETGQDASEFGGQDRQAPVKNSTEARKTSANNKTIRDSEEKRASQPADSVGTAKEDVEEVFTREGTKRPETESTAPAKEIATKKERTIKTMAEAKGTKEIDDEISHKTTPGKTRSAKAESSGFGGKNKEETRIAGKEKSLPDRPEPGTEKGARQPKERRKHDPESTSSTGDDTAPGLSDQAQPDDVRSSFEVKRKTDSPEEYIEAANPTDKKKQKGGVEESEHVTTSDSGDLNKSGPLPEHGQPDSPVMDEPRDGHKAQKQSEYPAETAGKDGSRDLEKPGSGSLPGASEHSSDPAAELKTDMPQPGSGEEWRSGYPPEPEAYYLGNAGLILSWPYLGRLFEHLEYLEGGTFRDTGCRERAVHLLGYIATGQEQCEEPELVLAKFLCAWPLQMPVIRELELTNEEKNQAGRMLESLIANWPILKNTSVEGLRSSFFIRDGKLFKEEQQWKLIVEQKSYDMLLDHLPYTISMIKLPWMEEILKVDWA